MVFPYRREICGCPQSHQFYFRLLLRQKFISSNNNNNNNNNNNKHHHHHHHHHEPRTITFTDRQTDKVDNPQSEPLAELSKEENTVYSPGTQR
jgi:G3E family GTPase